MLEWIYDSIYLENNLLLFIISVSIIILIIFITIILVYKELVRNKC